MIEPVPCTRIFSNGTEFEFFIEIQCAKCFRFRNGKCRIFNACMDARYDASKFPYSDLLEFEHYAGKRCKSFTDKPLERKRRNVQIVGQIEMKYE